MCGCGSIGVVQRRSGSHDGVEVVHSAAGAGNGGGEGALRPVCSGIQAIINVCQRVGTGRAWGSAGIDVAGQHAEGGKQGECENGRYGRKNICGPFIIGLLTKT